MRALALVSAVAMTALAGCGDGKDDQSIATAKVPAGCESAAPKQTQELPSELRRPAGNVLVETVRKDGDSKIVEGFVDTSPSAAVADLARQTELKILDQEDEGEDAEITISDGSNRIAYKLVKACEASSRFTAVIVAEP